MRAGGTFRICHTPKQALGIRFTQNNPSLPQNSSKAIVAHSLSHKCFSHFLERIRIMLQLAECYSILSALRLELARHGEWVISVLEYVRMEFGAINTGAPTKITWSYYVTNFIPPPHLALSALLFLCHRLMPCAAALAHVP